MAPALPPCDALLVIDVQQALCRGEHAAFDIDRVMDRLNALMAAARAAGAPVVLVQHEEDGGPLAPGGAGWQLAAGLQAQADDPRVRKRSPDAFFQTGLEALLRQAGARHLAVAGLQTEFCVDTTVRRALALGFDVSLAADAHSTEDGVISAEQAIAHHNRTLGWLGGFPGRVAVHPAAQIRFGRAAPT